VESSLSLSLDAVSVSLACNDVSGPSSSAVRSGIIELFECFNGCFIGCIEKDSARGQNYSTLIENGEAVQRGCTNSLQEMDSAPRRNARDESQRRRARRSHFRLQWRPER